MYVQYVQVLTTEENCKALNGEDKLLPLAIASASISHLQPQFSHSLCAFTRLASAFLLFRRLAAMLAPKLVLAPLPLGLEPLDYIDGTPTMYVHTRWAHSPW